MMRPVGVRIGPMGFGMEYVFPGDDDGEESEVTLAIPQFAEHLNIEVTAQVSGTGGGSHAMQFNGDTTSTYMGAGVRHQGNNATNGDNGDGNGAEQGHWYYLFSQKSGSATAAFSFAHATVTIPFYRDPYYKQCMSTGPASTAFSAAGQRIGMWQCRWRSTAAISTIRFFEVAGINLRGGSRIRIFGQRDEFPT